MLRTGEKYGYASFLCSKKLYPAGVKFVYQDIACKYGEWYAKAVAKVERCQQGNAEQKQLFLEPRRPAEHVLAEAHGRLHSVWCWVRVLINPWRGCQHAAHL